jgi:hypothetical protein
VCALILTIFFFVHALKIIVAAGHMLRPDDRFAVIASQLSSDTVFDRSLRRLGFAMVL